MRTPLVACGLLFALACSKKDAGPFEGEIVMKTTRAGSAAPTTMTLRAKGERLRFDTTAPDGKISHGVFDPAANKVVIIMDAEKAYMDIDFDKPSAQPNTNPETATLEKTGQKETIAGRTCEVLRVKDATGKRTEVCMTEGLVFFDLSSLKPGGGGGAKSVAELRQKKSFPLRSVEFDASGKEISRSEVVSINKMALDNALFDVPKDYAKIALPTPPPAPAATK
jgi:hypothetical protein